MTANSHAEPVVEVEILVTVDVPQVRPGAASQVHRIWLHRLERGGHSERQAGGRQLVHARRRARPVQKPLPLSLADFSCSCPQPVNVGLSMHARSFRRGCPYEPGHARLRWSTATSASTSTAAMSMFTSRPSNTGRWQAGQQRHLARLTIRTPPGNTPPPAAGTFSHPRSRRAPPARSSRSRHNCPCSPHRTAADIVPAARVSTLRPRAHELARVAPRSNAATSIINYVVAHGLGSQPAEPAPQPSPGPWSAAEVVPSSVELRVAAPLIIRLP